MFLKFALPSTSSLIELPNVRRRVGTNFSVRFRECQVYGGFCMLKTVVTHTLTQNSSVRIFFRQFPICSSFGFKLPVIVGFKSLN